jgi:lactam utilization protein B
LNRLVTVKLGAFAGGMLAWKHERGPGSATEVHPSSDDVLRVIRFYLKEKGANGIGWSYPDLLREGRREEEVEVEIEIDDQLWRQMEEEAARQGVSVTQLLEHAALYYAAELDAGRLTERILDDDPDEGPAS